LTYFDIPSSFATTNEALEYADLFRDALETMNIPAIQLPIWEKEKNQLNDAFASWTRNERSKKRLCSKRSEIFKKSSCFFSIVHYIHFLFFLLFIVHIR
jgi:hypothetical protein